MLNSLLPFLGFIVLFSGKALASGLVFSGDRSVELISIEEGGGGQYCIWQESAGSRAVDWHLKLLVPPGGMQLGSSNHPSISIPFDVRVQSAPGSPFRRIRSNETLIQGSRLSSYCEPGSSSFQLHIQPLGEPNLIPGGNYHQRLPVRLIASGGVIQDLELDLRLTVPERVGARVLDSIQLPRFDGTSASSGEARVCLFRNGGGNYSVRLRGDGANGEFVLQGRKELNFAANWRGAGMPAEIMEPGKISRIYPGSSHPDCLGGFNGQVEVSLPAHEAQRATSGRYQGRLRIIIQAR
ncbi:hypothetical protein [Parendozoicomonas sp. Alg238-R29]|uniref:hypothetical protein n=1 Tax=Parendozoicomonas sp. Alg238-R29 TaxID=2993446 RepID=UPI00248DA30C|nr:hypothetical protein [Parendozoicomonas sp. Alg238-R29]